MLEDSAVFQLQAPTNTTLGCINYCLTLEAKKELGKDMKMRIITINNNISSSSYFFPCSCSCSLKVRFRLELGFGKTELLARLPKEKCAPATPVTRTGLLAIQIIEK